jgi:hypothetical protein
MGELSQAVRMAPVGRVTACQSRQAVGTLPSPSSSKIAASEPPAPASVIPVTGADAHAMLG